jgi:hypothetical protein
MRMCARAFLAKREHKHLNFYLVNMITFPMLQGQVQGHSTRVLRNASTF